MHVQAEITVERPRAEVHEYVARGEKLPGYVSHFSSRAGAAQGQAGELNR
jgi:hypothetical protein